MDKGESMTSGSEADAQLIAAQQKEINDLRVQVNDWRTLALDLQAKLDANEALIAEYGE